MTETLFSLHIVGAAFRYQLEGLRVAERVWRVVNDELAGDEDDDAGDRRRARLSVEGRDLVDNLLEWEGLEGGGGGGCIITRNRGNSDTWSVQNCDCDGDDLTHGRHTWSLSVIPLAPWNCSDSKVSMEWSR